MGKKKKSKVLMGKRSFYFFVTCVVRQISKFKMCVCGGIEERGGGNSRMIYLIHCKNFCKCPSVPPPSTAMKRK
jgi:hypothetical protein